MNIIRVLKFLYKAKDPHFLSVSQKHWQIWSPLIRLAIHFNPNYKFCVIYRRKYKFLNNIVIVGLKWSGKNVKRRTSGFAKEFLQSNKDAQCIYCNTTLTNDNATTDHIIPISDGGNNAQVNLVVVCFDCNNERGSLDFYDYMRIKNPNRKNKYF